MKLPKRLVRMPDLVMVRLVLGTLLAALCALAVAGCGGGGSGESGGTEPAAVAPAGSPVYVEASIQPEGETKTNIEALAKNLAGIDDLGGLIATELEKSASNEGDEVDFEKEVEPWLGEKGAVFFPEFENGESNDSVVAIQVTDAGAAEDFLDKHAKSGGEPAEDGSYEGVDFKIEKNGTAVGVFEELLIVAQSEDLFKQTVEAAEGESLAEEDKFAEAVSEVPDGSAADVYVDIGALIKAAGSGVDPQAKMFLDSIGIEPEGATAVASAIPGSDQLEIDLSTDAAGENPPSGDASEMLGSLPADSVLALASAEFGKRFSEGIDKLDAQGIPGQVPPHQLKQTLKQQSGIDLESIASSIGDVGLFVEGGNAQSLGGALVLGTEDPTQASNTVSNIGLFLRASGTPGITAISGKATGFSIRSPELGRQPVVVAAKGARIAIAYGLAAATAALGESGGTLADSPTYKEALGALGGTPVSGFVDGHAALQLISSMIPPGEEEFRKAKKYLTKVDYVAIGSEASGDLVKAKLIVGVGK